jgi:hypothetical protein
VVGRGQARPGQARAAALAGGREARADLEELDVATAVPPVVADGVHEPGSRLGRITANFSESGLARATGGIAVARNGSACRASMKAK